MVSREEHLGGLRKAKEGVAAANITSGRLVRKRSVPQCRMLHPVHKLTSLRSRLLERLERRKRVKILTVRHPILSGLHVI
jgi:hypothetical protein